MQLTPTCRRKFRPGFTLAEIAIALGLVALIVMSVLGVINGANRMISRVIALDQAVRAIPALQIALSTKRPSETEQVRFNRWYQCVAAQEPLVSFSYRADADGVMNEQYGLPSPSTADPASSRLGLDYIIYDAVLPLTDFRGFLSSDEQRANTMVGQALIIKLKESPANPQPQSDDEPEFGVDPDTYPQAVVAAVAEFYVPALNTDAAINAAATATNLKPVHTVNVAFNR